MNNVEKYIIQLQDKFSGPMKNATDSAGGLENKMKGMSSTMLKVGAGLAVASLAIGKIISNGIKNYEKQEQSLAQVRQGLLTTGNAAGKTLDELSNSASKLQANSLFGDEDILQNVTAQFLTFTNIAGKQFDRVQQAALDVSTRLNGADASGESLKATSIMLGKALNDPVANLGALSRSGIQFSVSQKDVIKKLSQSGRLAEAQALILAELEKQYGGSAKAAADASTGQKQFQNALGDLSEKIGAVFYPAIQRMYSALGRFVKWMDKVGKIIMDNIPVIKAMAITLAVFLVPSILSLTAALYSQVSAWIALNAAMLLNPYVAVAMAIIALVGAMVYLYNNSVKFRSFFFGIGAVVENLSKRIGNLRKQFLNLFRKKDNKIEIEKVGESIGEAWAKGIEKGQASFAKSKMKGYNPAFNFNQGTSGATAADGSGAIEAAAESQPTSITGSAPKVFNINVDKLIDGFTISTNNLTESATAIKEHVTRALAEALADIQTVAS